MISRLSKRIFGRTVHERLPRLPADLNSEFAPCEIADRDIELILLAGAASSPEAARDLMAEYGVTNAPALIRLLPRRPPVDWRGRLHRYMVSIEGSYLHDPHAAELRGKRGDR